MFSKLIGLGRQFWPSRTTHTSRRHRKRQGKGGETEAEKGAKKGAKKEAKKGAKKCPV
jgi:hypothetical protein